MSREAEAAEASAWTAAERAYEAGDFARVRELCAQLARGEDRELAAKASALRDKIAVDPLTVGLLVFCLLAFGVIVHAYVF
ncbi:MAG TPA: hypothetical protein VHM19_11545 [Polyangiales bacterium]|jgi:hypothetical protein|nr:hypothetical protein [Polyangiales bacterium]